MKQKQTNRDVEGRRAILGTRRNEKERFDMIWPLRRKIFWGFTGKFNGNPREGKLL